MTLKSNFAPKQAQNIRFRRSKRAPHRTLSWLLFFLILMLITMTVLELKY